MSKERTVALRELLTEAGVHETPEYQIETLVIDECGMDDEKISMILGALLMQKGKFLRNISIMNCEMKQKSLEPLLKLLERSAPNNIEELRLVNLKGMENLQMKVTG